MKQRDQYLLRLANYGNGPVTLDASKNEFTITIPARIRALGRCLITVIGGNITLQRAESADTATRLVPDNTRMVYLQSNIPYLGYDSTQDGASSMILGLADLQGTADTTVAAIRANVSGPATFTCPNLPGQIRIKKWYLDEDNAPQPAQDYTTNLLPCDVTLQIEFIDSD